MTQPNILLITNDQHRFDFLANGPVPNLQTPNLNRLRREGTTLTNAFSSCPLCVPTRFTWFYGLRASQGNGAWGSVDTEWPTHLRSMPHALQNAGYHTAVIGKIHSHSGLHRMDLTELRDGIRARGFDDVFEVAGKSMLQYHDCDYTHYLEDHGLLDTCRDRLKSGGAHYAEPLPYPGEHAADAVIGRQARKWLDNASTEKPFFLHASFCDPHFPYDPPAEFAERFNPEDMPLPHGIDDPEFIQRYRKVCARYCALIEHCDHEIGLLLDTLDERGMTENTLVIFSTDHGDMMGSRGLFGKSVPYEYSVRTPIIVRQPHRVPAGARLPAPAESIDLPCSILEAAGLGNEPRKHLTESPGRSWWQYVTGQAENHRDYAYSEMGTWKMVADSEWKYIYRKDGNDELYNRIADPDELNNRITDPAQQRRIRHMQRQMIEAMSDNVAPPSAQLGRV